MEKKNYQKFLLMLCLSFVIMYIVMFLNVDKFDHIYFSLTRVYMALLMVSPMALMMLSFMGKMYANKKLNSIIYGSAIFVFFLSLLFLRTQVGIGDRQYMKAMIPHHSSAILTSKNASIHDPEVKDLSRQIIDSQEKEISQMKDALRRLDFSH